MEGVITHFKKPDLKAPRKREEVHSIYNKVFFEKFKKDNPEFKDVPIKDLKEIIKVFNGELWNHALNYRDGVELPENLGFIFLGTCLSPKKYNTDYGKSIQDSGLRHRQKNFDSDNFLAKIFYTNFANKYKFKNRELWRFTAVREFKRSVKDIYINNWKIYVQVENGKNISKYMQTYKKNEWFRNSIETFTIDPLYNEFDLN